MEIVAQLIMAATLILMVIGKTPLYSTAIVGSTIAALVYGIPLIGDAEVTIKPLVIGGLNPVTADMAGVLIFIGVMKYAGYLDVLVNAIVRVGNMLGRGPGVAAADGIAAGAIGAFTGFTQPAITAVVTGPASFQRRTASALASSNATLPSSPGGSSSRLWNRSITDCSDAPDWSEPTSAVTTFHFSRPTRSSGRSSSTAANR